MYHIKHLPGHNQQAMRRKMLPTCTQPKSNFSSTNSPPVSGVSEESNFLSCPMPKSPWSASMNLMSCPRTEELDPYGLYVSMSPNPDLLIPTFGQSDESDEDMGDCGHEEDEKNSCTRASSSCHRRKYPFLQPRGTRSEYTLFLFNNHHSDNRLEDALSSNCNNSVRARVEHAPVPSSTVGISQNGTSIAGENIHSSSSSSFSPRSIF